MHMYTCILFAFFTDKAYVIVHVNVNYLHNIHVLKYALASNIHIKVSSTTQLYILYYIIWTAITL